MVAALALAILCGAPGAWGSDEAHAAEEFRLLVYNTHGLPALLAGDDPETRFPRIGRLSREFDISLLQEDFAHHAELESTLAPGTQIERGPVSRFRYCPFCSGSGLTLLSRLPQDWRTRAESFAFDTCAGWLGGLNDCFATKGFQLLRFETGSRQRFFVVNTHLDAGRSEDDRAARSRQLDTIVRTDDERARGEALIVAGDLNLDQSDPADMQLLESFKSRLGLRDSGARGRAENGWSVLDYILLRDGTGASLRVLEAGEATGFQHDAAPLSDHPALFAQVRLGPGSGPSVE